MKHRNEEKMKRGLFLTHVFARVLGISVLSLLFAGCATSVPLMVQRPPAWNTLGIRRVAVMPFATTDNSALQRQAAAWLTNESFQRIQATNHFALVNSAEIQRIQAARGNIEHLTDALFSGQIISLSVHESSSQHQRRDREGRVTNFTVYRREVRMSFSYNLSRAGRGLDIIGSNTRRNLTTSSSSENRAHLRSSEAMVQELIQRNMAGVGRNMAPFMVTEQRRLEREPDRAIRPRAQDAEQLARAGNFRSAQEAFQRLYWETGSFAAGLNAGLLMEVQGDLEGAALFMQRLHAETGNPRAAAEVIRLQRAMDDVGLLYAFAANQTQQDRVIALMVDTLPARMPGNPRVALVNNTRSEWDLAEMVIKGLMDGFLSKNITVVDRSNRALLEMERNYQLSGYVRDDEIVSIGQEAGVNTFVLVAITGAGATRRLSVRMLDVERNIIIYQSPSTSEMNL